MRIERVGLIGERRIIVVSGRARKIDNEIDAHSFGRADAVAGRYAGAGRVRVHLAAVDAARHRGDEDVGAVVVARLGKADPRGVAADNVIRSEEHTSELQSLMRISYAGFCLKKK